MEKITIVGSGNMAYAILIGIAGRYDVEVAARDEERLAWLREEFGEKITVTPLHESFDILGRLVFTFFGGHFIGDTF